MKMPFADGMSTWPEGFASSNAHGCRPRSRWSSIPCSDRGGRWKWKDRGSCARFSLVDSLSDAGADHLCGEAESFNFEKSTNLNDGSRKLQSNSGNLADPLHFDDREAIEGRRGIGTDL